MASKQTLKMTVIFKVCFLYLYKCYGSQQNVAEIYLVGFNNFSHI